MAVLDSAGHCVLRDWRLVLIQGSVRCGCEDDLLHSQRPHDRPDPEPVLHPGVHCPHDGRSAVSVWVRDFVVRGNHSGESEQEDRTDIVSKKALHLLVQLFCVRFRSESAAEERIGYKAVDVEHGLIHRVHDNVLPAYSTNTQFTGCDPGKVHSRLDNKAVLGHFRHREGQEVASGSTLERAANQPVREGPLT